MVCHFCFDHVSLSCYCYFWIIITWHIFVLTARIMLHQLLVFAATVFLHSNYFRFDIIFATLTMLPAIIFKKQLFFNSRHLICINSIEQKWMGSNLNKFYTKYACFQNALKQYYQIHRKKVCIFLVIISKPEINAPSIIFFFF